MDKEGLEQLTNLLNILNKTYELSLQDLRETRDEGMMDISASKIKEVLEKINLKVIK